MIPIPANFAFLAVVALIIAFALLRWPDVGTLMATAILYLNLLPIAIRHHHVSPVIVIAVAALVVPALFKHWVLRGDGFIIDRPFLLMIAFLACITVSSMLSKNVELSLPWIARYMTQGILVYLLLINLIRSEGSLRRLTWVLVLCGGFLAGLAVYQELTGSYANDFGGLATRLGAEGPDTGPITKGVRRAHGPDLDADRYAQILIVLLPLAWCLITNEARLRARALGAICSSLILGGVLLTYSRGAFVGLLAMLGLMGILRAFTIRQALVVGVAVVMFVAVLTPGYVERLETLRGVGGLVSPASESQVEVDRVARTRATIMIVAWRVFLDHPIVGVGPGQFASLYVIDYGAELYFMDAIGRQYATHSLYLQLAAETGVVGLSVFLLIVMSVVTRLVVVSRRKATADKFVADLAAAAAVAIATYLVTGLFLHLAYPRYFWLLVGLGGVAVQLGRAGRRKDVETESMHRYQPSVH